MPTLAPPSPASAPTTTPTRTPIRPAPPKAGPGQLRANVAGVLSANHGTGFTVGQLRRELGNSGGAIGNACKVLVKRGEADLVADNPRRYAANGNTASAAAKAVITPRGKGHPDPAPTITPPQALASGPITRPNGQLYHPRQLADLPDVEVLQRLRAANIPVLLYGPPGTGKTSLIEAAFGDLITVAGDGDTTVGDLIGEYTQKADGGYEFIYGPLVNAMLQGKVLLLDDATLISPKVLAALYPAMDGRRQIIVKAHKGETITAEPGFYVIAGHNPGVHGAILTEALSSRFSVQIQVGSDYQLARSLNIPTEAVEVAEKIAKVTDLLGLDAAFANLVGVAPIEDRDLIAEIVTGQTSKPVEALRLGEQL
ncbi:MAG: AAA domain-containing protein [Catenulispora sp.]|nr:AAA domain-containing protein [Catenulispora sp.]